MWAGATTGLAFGAPAQAAQAAQQPSVVALNFNENPLGPFPSALKALQANLPRASRYPFADTPRFEALVARYAKAPAPAPGSRDRYVLIGVGSTEVMRSAAYAFLGPDRPLVTAVPSYGDPVSHANRLKAPVRGVPVDARLKLDLDAMLAQAGGAGMIYVCNPNNPTGTAHRGAALRDFVRQVNAKAPNCIVFVDEAYIDYADDPDEMTLMPEALVNPTVVVARTFSKAYGMAGMRLGYAVARPETLARMQPHQLGLTANTLTIAAGIAAMQDAPAMTAERVRNREAREYTRKALADMGVATEPAAGNFLFVPVKMGAAAFADACGKQGVMVGRPFPPMVSHSRITIGTMEEMRRAVPVFKSVLTA